VQQVEFCYDSGMWTCRVGPIIKIYIRGDYVIYLFMGPNYRPS